jgi:hypothetical protein
MNLAMESIHAFGLILGASCAQPHYKDVVSATRNEHNCDEVMSDPHSPASILLGFGGKQNPTRLGIPPSCFAPPSVSQST